MIQSCPQAGRAAPLAPPGRARPEPGPVVRVDRGDRLGEPCTAAGPLLRGARAGARGHRRP